MHIMIFLQTRQLSHNPSYKVVTILYLFCIEERIFNLIYDVT